jgi:hypothetical protein
MLFPLGIASFEEIRSWKCFDGDIGIDAAREVREYHIPDFSSWRDDQSYRKQFDLLLAALMAPRISQNSARRV